MVTRVVFTVFVLLVAVQRLFEVARGRRQARALIARGGKEHAHWQVPALAALHTTWLLGTVVEVWLLDPPFRPGLALAAGAVFVIGQALRLAAMRSLGERWTIAVITLPGTPRIQRGVYRYLRHPNYLGVVLEIAALPLIHNAIWSAAVFSAANAALLVTRIRTEEHALGER